MVLKEITKISYRFLNSKSGIMMKMKVKKIGGGKRVLSRERGGER